MKRNALVLLSVFVLLLVSSAVFAIGPEPLEVLGDCEGWSVSGYMHFGSLEQMDYDVTVELYDGETLIYSHYEEGTLYLADGATFNLGGRWGELELCGEYTLSVHFWWYGEYGPGGKKVAVPVKCECVPKVCTFTPGFWKNHPRDWPVDNLRVGCTDYTKRQLIGMLEWPAKESLAIKLFHHLVAAKLNVIIGADDSYIMRAINAGDEYFCEYRVLYDPTGDLRDHAERIKDALEDYNEIPCDEEEEEDDDMLTGPIPMMMDDVPSSTENSSWGSIKKKHK
jgi:hypothetical protein